MYVGRGQSGAGLPERQTSGTSGRTHGFELPTFAGPKPLKKGIVTRREWDTGLSASGRCRCPLASLPCLAFSHSHDSEVRKVPQ